MKFTLSWLKDHLETDASAAEIGEALTHLGLELEGISNPAEALRPFVIAAVIEARQHPNADRLRVCLVDPGAGSPVQVVCGAPNARSGMLGVFAPPGAYIPGTGIELKAGTIRGEASNGMLLSEREIGLSDAHEGIVDLPADAPVGTPYATWAGLDDAVIDVAVTPNRPDALAVRGIARDLAAKGIGRLKPVAAEPVAGGFASPITVALRFDGDATPCPFFVGRYFRGVRNGASPKWIERRLRAIGLRPISALVDITNLMTIAYGRPLHVFDADKIAGGLHARLARDGETIEALDGRTYALDPSMTIIADEAGPQGIAGIMGGAGTAVTPQTSNVLLESAYFDPVRTAATGRKLGINSDARYRFERGVDPAFTQPGAEIASRMILDLCGGAASELVTAGAAPVRELVISLRPERVRTLAGVDIPASEQTAILQALGFGVELGDGAAVMVEPPSWRPDIHGEADLVEEIIRIYGVDRIAHATLPRIEAVTGRRISTAQRRRFLAARTLAARGMNEAVTWSFLPKKEAELFGGGATALELANPISSELSDMRPSLLPNLIAAVRRNMARGFADLALCEVGQIYRGDQPSDERIHAAGVRRGMNGPRHWSAQRRPVDVFDAKADALAVLAAAGVAVERLQTVAEGPAWYHPGRVGALMLGPKNRLALFGEVHPRVLEAQDVAGPLVAFEVELDAIPLPKTARIARPPLDAPDLQAVTRDFAFVVDETISADRIGRAAKGADKVLIAEVSVFDVFAGEALGAGRKSVAVEVVLQPRERTLTEDEIERVSAAVVAAVANATGGEIRR